MHELDRIFELYKLKQVNRNTNVLLRKESTAEYVFSSMILAQYFLKKIKGLNENKVMKLLLYHDLVEVYAGDNYTFDVGELKKKELDEEAAAEKLEMIETGSTIDFGDFSSSTITSKAWKALSENDLEAVKVYVAKNLELYEAKATEMQGALTEYPWETNEKVFEYWALNDVGTSLFILGEAYRKAGDVEKAKEAYQRLVKEFFYAQCWDNGGWFWKPAEAAQGKISELE